MNIKEFRAQNPEYGDMSDEEIARGLHQKYYSDVDFDQFRNAFAPIEKIKDIEPNPPSMEDSAFTGLRKNDLGKQQYQMLDEQTQDFVPTVSERFWNVPKAFASGFTSVSADQAKATGVAYEGTMRGYANGKGLLSAIEDLQASGDYSERSVQDIARKYNLKDDIPRLINVAGRLQTIDEYNAAGKTNTAQMLLEKINAQKDEIKQGITTDPRRNFLYKAGKKTQDFVDNSLGIDPALRDEFVASQVPGALGQATGFMLEGLTLRRAGKKINAPERASLFVGAAAPGVASSYIGAFEEALAKGQSFETAYKVAERVAPIGVTEALPISRMLDRLDKGSGGVIRQSIVNAIKEGTEEALQEVVQQIYTNAQHQGVYDPKRGLWTGTADGAAVGFTSGAILGFVTDLAFGRHHANTTNKKHPGDELRPEDLEINGKPSDPRNPPPAPGTVNYSSVNLDDFKSPKELYDYGHGINYTNPEQDNKDLSISDSIYMESHKYDNGIDVDRIDLLSTPDYQIETPRQADRRVARDNVISEQEQQLNGVTLPPEFEDPRLKRLDFRDKVKALSGELVEGGGLGLVPDENYKRGESDGGAVPLRNLPSVNPKWAQSILADTGLTVSELKNAIDKALSGERLGIRQAQAVSSVLDQVTTERTSKEHGNLDYAKQQLEKARELRRTFAGFGESANPDNWLFDETQYAPESDAAGRVITELAEQARALGEQVADQAEIIMERQIPDEAVIAQLSQLVRGQTGYEQQQEEIPLAAGDITGPLSQEPAIGQRPIAAPTGAGGADLRIAPTGLNRFAQPQVTQELQPPAATQAAGILETTPAQSITPPSLPAAEPALKPRRMTKEEEQHLFGRKPNATVAHRKDESKAPLQDKQGAPSADYFVEYDGMKHPVLSIEDAQNKWNAVRQKSNIGASDMTDQMRVYDKDNNLVGTISYNGRFHPKDGLESNPKKKGIPESARKKEGEPDDALIRDLKKEWSKYDDTGEYTHADLVDAVESIINDSSSVDAKTISNLSDAVSRYRKEQQDDSELGGRNDMDAAEDTFNSALSDVINGKQKPKKNNLPESALKKKPESTAPEHANIEVGVDEKELDKIVDEFNQFQNGEIDNGDKVTHIFDAPKQSEIVRLQDVVKVYTKEHGWMTPEEAKKRIDEWEQHALDQYNENDAARKLNGNKVVISLFDKSGAWSRPWEQAGYQVYRFDIQNEQMIEMLNEDTGEMEDINAGDILNMGHQFFADLYNTFDGKDVHAILAACPCTDFAVSGARHFAAKDSDGRTIASVKLVHKTLEIIEYFKPAVWGLENPVGRIEKLGGLPPWRLSFDPNHLGESYTKKTLIWGRFNAELPVAPVEPTEGSKMHQKYGGKSLKTKNARSVTPDGFSYAFFMANNAYDHPAMTIANKYDRLDKSLIEKAVNAGITEEQIDNAVEDYYYIDLNDEAANKAIQEMLAEKAKPAEKSGKIKAKAESRIILEEVKEEGAHEIAKEKNKAIRWVNELSDADYNYLKAEYGQSGVEQNSYRFPKSVTLARDPADPVAEWKRALNERDNPKPEAPNESIDFSIDEKKQSTYGKSNKVFTQDAADKARALLKSKLKNLNAGLDPEMMQAGITLAGYHIEAGARSFAAFAKAMIEDLGESVKPYLRSWYEGVRHWPEFNTSGMSTVQEIDEAATKKQVSDVAQKQQKKEAKAEKAAKKQKPAEPDLFSAIVNSEETQNEQPRADNRTDNQGSESKPVQPNEGDRGVAGDNVAVPGADQPSISKRGQGSKKKHARSKRLDGSNESNAPSVEGREGNGNGEHSGRTADVVRTNYRITESDILGEGGPLTKARANVEAIRIIKQLRAEGRGATAEEQSKLVKYVGWGDSAIANKIFPSVGEREASWEALHNELRDMMTDEEYKTAVRSTQYAHYTSPDVINAMYSALEKMGLQSGIAFEAGLGVGHFIGLKPSTVNLQYAGVEMDVLSADIAKALYPEAGVINGDFTRFGLPENYYDVVLGNPPFGDISIKTDPKYRGRDLKLHDYFIVKQIDALRPGGIAAFVTSRYTMDKQDIGVRADINQKASLLGAIRLPNTAFKQNAGTEVVTDILFFQKRAEELSDENKGKGSWIETATIKTPDGEASINEYFASNRKMILGDSRLTGTMYGANQYTVEQNGDIASQLTEAVSRLPSNIVSHNPTAEEMAAKAKAIELNPGKTENSFYIDADGKLREVVDGVGVPVLVRGGSQRSGLSKKQAEILTDYIPLREATLKVYREQMNDGDWQGAQKELHAAYDKFVSKHGAINQSKIIERSDGTEYIQEPIISVIDTDPEAFRVIGIESYDEATGEATKQRIFFEKVANKDTKPTIDTAMDALHVSLNDRGGVDLDYMAELYKADKEDIIAELGVSLFHDPVTDKWQTFDEYLSGNVKAKLRLAKDAAAKDAAAKDANYNRNVEALEAVQPADLPISRIPANLGAGWIPVKVIESFAHEMMGFTGKISKVIKKDVSGWTVEGKVDDQRFSTARMSANDILEHTLNRSTITIYDHYREDGAEKTEVNVAETSAANQKAQELKEEFGRWVLSNDEAATTLHEIYNRDFNTDVPRKYDGRHLRLSRLSEKYKLFDWQKNVVWRILQNGNTYMAHTVGAGKTLAASVAGIELKRLGLARKPTYVVLKSTLKQFATEMLDAYPDAKILVADEKQLDKKNRRRFLGKLINEEWDAVIMTHQSFEKISMSDEYIQDHIEKEIAGYREVLEQMDEKDRGPRKRIEKKIESLENRLRGNLDTIARDRGITFEETGIDFVFVDEAHHHKKIPFSTVQTNIKGISSDGSQIAEDLFIKSQYLNSLRPGKSMVLMSGTPVTNTLGEVFNIQRYLQPWVLQSKGISTFDMWSATFADTVTNLEMQANGGFKPVTRMAKFVGVPSLLRDFLQVADIVSDNDLKQSVTIKRPTVRGGERQIVAVSRSPELKDYMLNLGSRITSVENRKGPPKKGEDNILVIINDAKKASIDLRLVGREQTTPSKLDALIDRVFAEYERTKDTAYKNKGKDEPVKGGTQMIFTEIRSSNIKDGGGSFDVYEHIRSELVKRGMPKESIAFIQDANTSQKKKKLFRDMNTGVVKVMIGGSKSMGTGVNAQQRITMLHHLDIDYLPANIVQREGRGIRQGNKNTEVGINAYATEGTIDAFMWQLNETKQRMIDQVMSGDLSIDQVEDVSDSADQMAQAKALASGNPMLLELAGVTAEVKKLSSLREAFYNQKHSNAKKLQDLTRLIDRLKSRLSTFEELAGQYVETKGEAFSATIKGTTFTERKDAGAKILDLVKAIGQIKSDKINYNEIGKIGGYSLYVVQKFGGVDLALTKQDSIFGSDIGVVIFSPNIAVEAGEVNEVGLVRRIENLAASIKSIPSKISSEIVLAEKKIENINNAPKTFQYEADLAAKSARLDEIERALERGDVPDSQEKIDLPDGGVSFSLDHVFEIPYTVAEALQKANSLPKTIDINTPERVQLRKQIAGKLYGDGAKNKDRRLDIVMGKPASGKTSVIASPIAQQFGSLLVDSDMAKRELPEFDNGVGGNAVHEESSRIAKRILAKAVAIGDNITYATVGSDIDSLKKLINSAKNNGYKIYVTHVDISTREAAKRAVSRYIEDGQLVDPEYIMRIGHKPKENFESLIEGGNLDGHAEYSNEVGKGQPPVKISSSPEYPRIRYGGSGSAGDGRLGSGDSRSQEGTGKPGQINQPATDTKGPQEAGLSFSEVNKIAADFVANWNGRLNVHVVPHAGLLPDNFIKAHNIDDTLRAFYLKGSNHIYIIANKQKTERQVIKAILHEATHYGLEVFYGDKVNEVYDMAYRAYVGTKTLSNIAKVYKLDLSKKADQRIAGDEILAHIAELGPVTKAEKTLWQKIVQMFRDVLRKLGVNIKLSDNEIRDILANALSVNTAIAKEAESALNEVYGDVRFSLDDESGGGFDSKDRFFAGDLKRKARIWAEENLPFTDSKVKHASAWDKTVGSMYNLAKRNRFFRPVFDIGQAFLNDVSQLSVAAEQEAGSLFLRMDNLKSAFTQNLASESDVKVAARAIYRGTVIDEKIYSDDELKQLFDMDDAQVSVYRQAVNAAHKSLDDAAKASLYRYARVLGVPAGELRAAKVNTDSASEFMQLMYDTVFKPMREGLKDQVDTLTKLVNTTQDPSALTAANAQLSRASGQLKSLNESVAEMYKTLARMDQLKTAGYFPLMRFGKYYVDVVTTNETTGETNREAFLMFESSADARIQADNLAQEYPDAQVRVGTMSMEQFKLFQGISPETVEAFARHTGMDKNEMFQDYLKLAVSNRSAMKRLIKRKNMAGFSMDLRRSLAGFILSNSRLAAASYHMGEMIDAIEGIPNGQGDVKDIAVNLRDYLINPTEEFSGLRNFLFFNYLGGSIAAAVVNLTQIPMATYPYLSQWGAAHAAKVITKWAAGAKPFDSRHAADIKRAEEEGILSPQEVYNLMATARGGQLPFLKSYAAQRALFAWGSMFGAAENYNRHVTFNAAYEVARKNGIADPYRFAVEAVRETQFIYNRGNRPQWARGIGAPIFTFKQFTINYLEYLNRLPAQQKAIAFALIILAAGLEGLPFAEDIEDIIDTIMQWLGYDFSTKQKLYEWAKALVGKEGAKFVTEGLSTVIPIDIHGRLGMQNIIPGTSLLMPSKSHQQKTDEALDVLGAASGVARNIVYGTESALKGDAWQATKSIAPKAVKDLMQGISMMASGKYYDSQNRPVMNVGIVDAISKSIGFHPSKVAREQRVNRTIQNLVQYRQTVEDGISDQLARAIVFRDEKLKRQAMDSLRAWNKRNPDWKIAITAEQISQKATQMMLTKDIRNIKHVAPEIRGKVYRMQNQ